MSLSDGAARLLCTPGGSGQYDDELPEELIGVATLRNVSPVLARRVDPI